MKILGGSFSAVWTPLIARVGAFFSMFRDLQDFHSFAPLHIQKFNNMSLFFSRCFHLFFKMCIFLLKFVVFQTDFDENFREEEVTKFGEIFRNS